MKRFAAAAVAAWSIAAPGAQAGEVVFGLGKSAYLAAAGRDSALLSAELHGPVIGSLWGADLRPMLVADRHRLGDSFLGAGLSARWALREGWFADAGVAPGIYHAAVPANDLGGKLEFRSHLGLGRALGRGQALSLAFVHKSNAGTGRVNPGMHTVLLRWHQGF